MVPPSIVIDTNVFVAALRSRYGASNQLLRRVGTGLFDLHLSVPVVLEYEEVLLRQLPPLTINEEDVHALLDYLCQVASYHEIFFLWRPILRDPDDDMFLELAVGAGCTHLVTHNLRDFAGLERFGIVACTPHTFLRELGVLQ